VKKLLKNVVKTIFPRHLQLWLSYNQNKLRGTLDPEMLYVERILTKRRRFLDIGANVGIYSFHFSSTFAQVDAYEPISEITYRLRDMGRESIHTHSVALSNGSGDLNFYIPIRDGNAVPGLASLEMRDKPYEERLVKVKRLDDYVFEDVDLIKIDVEGHESSVIKGAIQTIQKTFPILIVEIEQRHISKPIDEVFSLITEIGYDGYFLKNDELISIEKFSYSIHQEPFLSCVNDDAYINNFIFLRSDNAHNGN
jgi:FkbM family methyltransferase